MGRQSGTQNNWVPTILNLDSLHSSKKIEISVESHTNNKCLTWNYVTSTNRSLAGTNHVVPLTQKAWESTDLPCINTWKAYKPEILVNRNNDHFISWCCCLSFSCIYACAFMSSPNIFYINCVLPYFSSWNLFLFLVIFISIGIIQNVTCSSDLFIFTAANYFIV